VVGIEMNSSTLFSARFRSRIAKAKTKNPVGVFFTYLKIAKARP
jgi:hypothetical protein